VNDLRDPGEVVMSTRTRRDEMQQVIYPGDPWTAVKQDVYRRYAQCWMPKILQKGFFRGSIVDPFSYSGMYTEGLEGSPLTIGRTYLTHGSRERMISPLRLVWSDERSDRLEELERQWSKVKTQLGEDPNLHVDVDASRAGAFVDLQPQLALRANDGASEQPILWIIDPYGWEAIPIESVKACLAHPRAEVIVTLMTRDLHRHRGQEDQRETISRCLGSDAWLPLRDEASVAAASSRFAEVYRHELEKLPGVMTRRFAIAFGTGTPKYELIFATHNKGGLACWNQAGWGLDRYRGGAASEEDAGALTLFDDSPYTQPLRDSLEQLSGRHANWAELELRAAHAGFKPTHVRQVLSEMAGEGHAIRVDNIGGKTAWPEGCEVQFYSSGEISIGTE
jgi:three-Cys-motif partner protein